MMRPQTSGGKKSDSAITMKDNTGANVLTDIVTSVEGNLRPSWFWLSYLLACEKYLFSGKNFKISPQNVCSQLECSY